MGRGEPDDWVGVSRIVFAYDVDGNRTELMRYNWELETNDWVYYTKRVSYWSELTISIPVNSIRLNCIIYPNPTWDGITIETDRFDHYSIDITSLKGQLIYNTQMDGTTHQLDLSSFQKGIYLITIRSKDFVITRKIIKLLK